MTVIAVIPARGGSVRVPGKNAQTIGGKSLVYWAAKAALETPFIDHVLLSTDDEAMFDLVDGLGVEYLGKRQFHADHESPVSLASLGEVEVWERTTGLHADIVVQLMPTSPFRRPEDISCVLSPVLQGIAESALSVVPFIGANPWWSFKFIDEDRYDPFFLDAFNMRSQDLPNIYGLSGAVWVSTFASLERSRSFSRPESRKVEIPWLSGFEIDTPHDLVLARILHTIRNQLFSM